MKNFLKVIVFIAVILVSIGEVYFLISEDKLYKERVVTFNGTPTPIIIPKEKSGDEENQTTKPQSSIVYSSMEEFISSINKLEEINNTSKIKNSIEDRVGLEVIGQKYEELFKITDARDTGVNIQVAGSMINILPNSDFIDRQAFHYDENGNLVLYVVEGSGSGFITRYYVFNDVLVSKIGEDAGEIYSTKEEEAPKIIFPSEESGEVDSGNKMPEENSGDKEEVQMILDETDFNDIISRAKNLYNKYLKY